MHLRRYASSTEGGSGLAAGPEATGWIKHELAAYNEEMQSYRLLRNSVRCDQLYNILDGRVNVVIAASSLSVPAH